MASIPARFRALRLKLIARRNESYVWSKAARWALVLLPLGSVSPASLKAQRYPQANPPRIDQLPPPSEADKAWDALLDARRVLSPTPDDLLNSAPGSAQRQAALEKRAQRKLGFADKARAFYLKHPEYYWAHEAHFLEVLALIDAAEDGNNSASNRLRGAIATLKGDKAAPDEVLAKAIAAYKFHLITHPTNGEKSTNERTEIEAAAKELITEFPYQPEGYQALWALCRFASIAESQRIAETLYSESTLPYYQENAKRILNRNALIGKDIRKDLGLPAEIVDALPTANPVIIYSWGTQGENSLELGRMLQARRFDAVGICLDTNIELAESVQKSNNLGGEHLFDEKGYNSSLAESLGFTTSGQIYLTDKEGIIRDVQGGVDLESKLNELGFETPVLTRP